MEEQENTIKNDEEKTDETPKAISLAEAKEVTEKLREQNEVMNKNITRMEELKATELLSGTANAGTVPEKKLTDEEKSEVEAKAFRERMGYD